MAKVGSLNFWRAALVAAFAALFLAFSSGNATAQNGGLQSGAPWPIAFGTLGDTNLGVAGGATPVPEWSQTGYGGYTGQVISAEGTIFLIGQPLQNATEGPTAYTLLALDGTSGNNKWTYSFANGEEPGSPTIGADGTVYVSTNIGLYAFNGGNGQTNWVVPASNDNATSPTIGRDGTIYLLSGNAIYDEDVLNAFDSSGSLKWQVSLESGCWYVPPIGPDGTIYVSGYTDWSNGSTTNPIALYAVNPASGSIKWTYEVDNNWASAVSVGPDGTIYTEAIVAVDPSKHEFNMDVAALDSTGTKKWDVILDNELGVGAPIVGTNGVLFIDTEPSQPSGSFIIALSSSTGSQLWSTQLDAGSVSTVAITPDGTLYVSSFGVNVTSQSQLLAWDGETGKQKWSFTLPGPLAGFAIAADGSLIVGTNPLNNGPGSYPYGQLLALSSSMVSGFYASPGTVVGGSSTHGVLQLTQAGTNSCTFSLASSSSSLVVPSTVTVPAGSKGISFALTTLPVSATQSITVTATYGSTVKQASITLNPSPVSSLSVTPGAIGGGNNGAGIVRLAGDAGPAGDAISLSSSSKDVVVPNSVAVPAGQTEANFSFSSLAITGQETVTITATFGGATKQATVTLGPAVAHFYASPSSITGGGSTYGVVQLGAKAASGGVMVSLSHGGSFVSAPSSVTVPAGSTGVSFLIGTEPVSTKATWTLVATLNGTATTTALTLNPYPLSNLYASPATVVGGQSTHGVVQLAGKAGPSGAVVSLTRSDSHVTVPASVTVPAGSIGVSFSITTSAVAGATAVTVTASCDGVTQRTTISLQP